MSGIDQRSGGAASAAASAFGRVLAGAFAAAGRLRPAAKPLHPRGAVSSGTLIRRGLARPTGVGWLDEPGRDDVVVRMSRAIGLPGPLPDVLGLAVRVPLPHARHADLLLSTTGRGRVGRWVLVPARDASTATFSTLMPYRTPAGPRLIAARPAGADDELCFELETASPAGEWRPFGTLRIDDSEPTAPDGDIAFDAITNTVPGLEPYEWMTKLREGAYRAARRSRGDDRIAP